jgi:hypothetical protein
MAAWVVLGPLFTGVAAAVLAGMLETVALV